MSHEHTAKIPPEIDRGKRRGRPGQHLPEALN